MYFEYQVYIKQLMFFRFVNTIISLVIALCQKLYENLI